MAFIGECPFCKGRVLNKKINVNGKKVVLYSCENNKVVFDECEEVFLKDENNKCSFRIFSNALLRYGKRSISEKEVKKLLLNQELEVRLYSKKLFNEETGKYGSEYFKYIIPDIEYGISVIFD